MCDNQPMQARSVAFRLSKIAAGVILQVCLVSLAFAADSGTARAGAQKIIIDTDIGDDIDDAFALALALRSPELTVIGVSTTFGDTTARAKIADRLLGEAGHDRIPVAVGIPTAVPSSFELGGLLTQRHYGEGGDFVKASHPNAVDFILEQIRRRPGEITLVAIGPLSNIGALIERDLPAFRKLKRVVLMGGSIAPVKPDFGSGRESPQIPEWNIRNDIPAAQQLFRSGVPLYVMPLDATAHLQLDEVKRQVLFTQGGALTDSLARLYQLWNLTSGHITPVLYDAMPIAFIGNPELCPVTPMHVSVDDQGFTRKDEAGPANAHVCLRSDADAFFRFYLLHLVGSQLAPSPQ
jgi:purine nucleosidase